MSLLGFSPGEDDGGLARVTISTLARGDVGVDALLLPSPAHGGNLARRVCCDEAANL